MHQIAPTQQPKQHQSLDEVSEIFVQERNQQGSEATDSHAETCVFFFLSYAFAVFSQIH